MLRTHKTDNGEMRPALPHDLTRLTREQIEWCVAYHAAMPLREIRRRQELAERQIGLAWRQRNEFALAKFQVAARSRAIPVATLRRGYSVNAGKQTGSGTSEESHSA